MARYTTSRGQGREVPGDESIYRVLPRGRVFIARSRRLLEGMVMPLAGLVKALGWESTPETPLEEASDLLRHTGR